MEKNIEATKKEDIIEKQQPIRDTLYGRINVSVKGLDRFIAVMVLLLILLVYLSSKH